jgi:rod shape determining protein RodA
MELTRGTIRRLARSSVDGIDPMLLTLALMLTALGIATLYSASHESPGRVVSQLRHLAVALCAMWLVARLPIQLLMRSALPVYLAGMLLLVCVALFGDVVNGARRWLSVGGMRFQPSEMMKIAVPLMLAWYFHRNEGNLRRRAFVVAGLLVVVPALLIARQPDLGTALLVAAAGFYVIFFAGLSWKAMGALAAIALVSLPPIWSLLHDYQRRRILTLLDPTQDPLGAGYHIIQSTIAIGSGGLSGKGWLNGTQAHLEFIPERHTDFIFAVYSEEFGLIGSCVLLVLYALLIARGMAIAAQGATLFARLLGGALSLIFFTYAFVNMGMVSGVLPVVGVPLPFLSYGGTALLTLFVAIGLLMSVQKHRRLIRS